MRIRIFVFQREKQHKVFKGVAKKAKSTICWFFGFKLHLVVNDKGEIIAFKLTAAGNVDDRKPVKNICQIEHSRHRSIWNFAANILAALCAYCLQPKKTSINLKKEKMLAIC